MANQYFAFEVSEFATVFVQRQNEAVLRRDVDGEALEIYAKYFRREIESA